jgi:chaperonin GroEL (HSP60 family)
MQRAVWGQAVHADVGGALAPVLRAIAASVGPEGRHVVYATGNKVAMAATGVDIARQACSDHFAARIMKEALVDAERDLGDGTARLAVMAGAALGLLQRRIAAGAVPERVLSAVNAMRADMDAAFAAETAPVGALVPVGRAAGASAGLAGILAEASEAVGPGGLIEVLESREPGVHMAVHEGFVMQARPVGSEALAALDRVHLIVVNDVIRDFRKLAPVIEGFAQSDKALLIVARGLEDQALALIERNRKAGILRVAALVPVVAGPKAAHVLEDLAVATGAVLVSDDTGTRLEALRPAMLGRADRFRREGTLVTLTGPGGDPARVGQRLREIEAEVGACRYLTLDREQAARRHACLSGTWAELRIGSRDGQDLRAARSAIAAIQSARAQGVIQGAGCGLDRIADRLAQLPAIDAAQGAARDMVCVALRAPGVCLRRNAGEGCPPSDGGLADPAGLSRTLLDTALSLAGQLAGIQVALLRQGHRTHATQGAA